MKNIILEPKKTQTWKLCISFTHLLPCTLNFIQKGKMNKKWCHLQMITFNINHPVFLLCSLLGHIEHMVRLEKEQTPSFLFSINICFREVLPATWFELCCHGYFSIPASSTSFSASCHQSTVSSSTHPLRTQNYTHQFLVIRRHFLPKMALSYWSLRSFLVLGKTISINVNGD